MRRATGHERGFRVKGNGVLFGGDVTSLIKQISPPCRFRPNRTQDDQTRWLSVPPEDDPSARARFKPRSARAGAVGHHLLAVGPGSLAWERLSEGPPPWRPPHGSSAPLGCGNNRFVGTGGRSRRRWVRISSRRGAHAGSCGWWSDHMAMGGKWGLGCTRPADQAAMWAMFRQKVGADLVGDLARKAAEIIRARVGRVATELNQLWGGAPRAQLTDHGKSKLLGVGRKRRMDRLEPTCLTHFHRRANG